MSEDRSRILNMLAEGKISAEEAERLLDALDSRAASGGSTAGSPDRKNAFLLAANVIYKF